MARFLADVVGKEAIIGGNEAWSDDTNVRSMMIYVRELKKILGKNGSS